MWGDCMGRPRFHRQNLLVQTNSVEQKCLFHWLVRESMDRFGLSFEEARSVAAKGLGFLNQETDRMINQIVFPLISAEYAHQLFYPNGRLCSPPSCRMIWRFTGNLA
jgi:hypothetical protein